MRAAQCRLIECACPVGGAGLVFCILSKLYLGIERPLSFGAVHHWNAASSPFFWQLTAYPSFESDNKLPLSAGKFAEPENQQQAAS